MADLHAVVLTNGRMLVMASFFGIDSVVRGVAAGIISGQEIVIWHPALENERVASPYGYYVGDHFYSYRNGYRMFTRPFITEPGRKLVHCVVIHERCFASEYMEGESVSIPHR